MVHTIILGIFGILAFLIINNKQNKIIMQNKELAQDLLDLKAEVDNQSVLLDQLAAAINTNPEAVPQNVVDAFNALKGSADVVNTKLINLTTPTTGTDSSGSAPADNGSAPAENQ